MTPLIVVCLALVVTTVVLVMAPFGFGQGGLLLAASTNESVEVLRATQTEILKQWLSDEALSLSGSISEREWKLRQEYLMSRYVDASRRLDFLMRGQPS